MAVAGTHRYVRDGPTGMDMDTWASYLDCISIVLSGCGRARRHILSANVLTNFALPVNDL